MKMTASSIPFIIMLAFAMYCHCQATQAVNFASLPLKEAEAAINNRDSKGDFPQMAKDALASRRLDLIELLFEYQHFSGYLYRALRDTTDEPFKARVVLMMLRSKSGFWPPDFYTTGFFPRRPLDEPIKGVLKKYLPNENVDDDTVATADSRLAVAEKLSSALEKSTKSKPVDAQAPAVNQKNTAPPPAPNTAPSEKPAQPIKDKESVSTTPWSVVAVVTVAVIALSSLLFKERK